MPFVLRPSTDILPLPDRLTSLGYARRVAIGLRRTFEAFAFIVAFAGVCIASDIFFHLPGYARALLLCTWLIAGVAMLYRAFIGTANIKVTPLAVAQLLERNYLRMNDALASGVDFCSIPQNFPGTSRRFRNMAIVRAIEFMDRYNVSSIIPSGKAWRAFALAVMAFAVVVPYLVYEHQRSPVAVVRLFDPYGIHPWPTKTRIVLNDAKQFPLRQAAGDSLTLNFTVSGIIPESATLHVRTHNGDTWDESYSLGIVDSKNPKPAQMTQVIEGTRIPRDFDFRLTAGDGETPWYSVNVAPPPKLVKVPTIRLTFPEYTRIPPIEQNDANMRVDAILGTRVQFSTATDRPISSAMLVPQVDRSEWLKIQPLCVLSSTSPFAAYGAMMLGEQATADIPVIISGANRDLLDIDFVPGFAGRYVLKFTDMTGLTGTRIIDLPFKTDPAPNVNLDRPLLATDAMMVLPGATITVYARAEDRTYAVQRLFLEYQFGRDELSWMTRSISDPTSHGHRAIIGSALTTDTTRLHPPMIEGGMTIPVKSLVKRNGTLPVPGDVITLRAAATDFDDGTILKAPGRSQSVEIRIVDVPTLEGYLQRELTKLRNPLLQMREEQRNVRERTEKPTPETLPQINRDQQAIQDKLSDPRDGMQRTVEQLDQLSKTNQLPRSPVTERLEQIQMDINRLSDNLRDEVTPKLAKGDPANLNKAVRQQKTAELTLDAILQRLELWVGAGEVRAEALALKDQLGKLTEDADKAAQQLPMGKLPEQLTPQERAQLNRIAEHITQLGERATGAMSKAERVAGEKEKQAAELEKKAAAATGAEAESLKQAAARAAEEAKALRDALDKAGVQQLLNDIQNAAKELKSNNPSRSADARQSAMQRFDKLAEMLGEKQNSDDALLEKKKKTADAIDALAEKQDELAKKTKEALANPDSVAREEALQKLAREQQALKEQTEKEVERLTREQLPEAAEQLRKAAEKMEAAQNDLAKGKNPGDQQNQALDKLDETVKQLDKEREKDNTKLEKEKNEELTKLLQSIRDRLQAAEDEAGRIQKEAAKAQGWDRALIASMGDLEDRIKPLAEDLEKISANQLEPLPVFQRLAEQATRQAEQSAKRFGERKRETLDNLGEPWNEKIETIADERTRNPLRTAIRRIDHILNAIKDDAKKPDMKPMDMAMTEPMPMMPDPMMNPAGAPPIAQLKALRSIQAELNERTAAFAKAHPDKNKLDDNDKEELAELERSQREVADLFRKLAPLFKPMGEKP